MSDDTGKSLLLVTFLAAIGLVTWTEIGKQHQVPRPQRYVGAGLTYGILGLLAPVLSYPLVGLFGIGLLLSLWYTYYQPTASNGVGSAAGTATGGTGGSAVGGAAGSASPSVGSPNFSYGGGIRSFNLNGGE